MPPASTIARQRRLTAATSRVLFVIAMVCAYSLALATVATAPVAVTDDLGGAVRLDRPATRDEWIAVVDPRILHCRGPMLVEGFRTICDAVRRVEAG